VGARRDCGRARSDEKLRGASLETSRETTSCEDASAAWSATSPSYDQKGFTHPSVLTFDRVPFQLTDELFS
jgi:hypothetical protein